MRKSLLALLLTILVCFFPLFMYLGKVPLHQWDESRLGVNPVEMKTSGDLFVTTYLESPDNWNTKPPLLIWFQALSLNFITDPELAVRLPSAIAAFLTAIFLFLFCHKFLNYKWAGVLSALVFVTIPGILRYHVARSADYDAMLVMWVTFYVLCYYVFIDRRGAKYLYLGAFCVALAVWTKGVAGLLLLPGLLVFILLSRNIKTFFSNKHFYFSSFISLAIIAFFYLVRESLTPGYLKDVWANEIAGRFTDTLEAHQEPAMYYIDNILRGNFGLWLYVLPVALAAIFVFKVQRRLSTYLLCIIVCFLAFISISKTKLPWYDAPVYPLLSILCGIGLYALIAGLQKRMLKITALIMLVAFSIFTYYRALADFVFSEDWDMGPEHASGYFFNQYEDNEHMNFKVLTTIYNPVIDYYVQYYRDKGWDINFVFEPEDVEPMDSVVTVQPELVDSLKTMYIVHEMDAPEKVYFVRVERKP